MKCNVIFESWFTRRSRISIELSGQKEGSVSSYTTSDKIEGTATIIADHDTKYDHIKITFEGAIRPSFLTINGMANEKNQEPPVYILRDQYPSLEAATLPSGTPSLGCSILWTRVYSPTNACSGKASRSPSPSPLLSQTAYRPKVANTRWIMITSIKDIPDSLQRWRILKPPAEANPR
ncbi:hypothetical protein BDV41DRAFT_570723 [Aspergillus transmontanensis]|uniref:Uncharacterized protein n=1 Tax=Aspergillus transmontanensis TaxID=1034304 RepID=A0A5N6WG13_9EURO|nr:hypothetical protein BDV41DRAFT_570723 [Aspergillus transmontanensis]